ncbi:MAG: PilZ domain-containing protein [Archangiaceae bacterium]|nr:PilZ domain-containing protein [Archangiaceae bacterium]
MRHRCELLARLEREGADALEVKVLDLSEHGAFIEETAALQELQVGDPLTLTIALPGGSAWSARGLVTRLGTSRREVKHPTVAHVTVSAVGFGVEFSQMADDALEQLRDYLELLDER